MRTAAFRLNMHSWCVHTSRCHLPCFVPVGERLLTCQHAAAAAADGTVQTSVPELLLKAGKRQLLTLQPTQWTNTGAGPDRILAVTENGGGSHWCQMLFTYREIFRDRVQEPTAVSVTFEVIGNGGSECFLRATLVFVGVAAARCQKTASFRLSFNEPECNTSSSASSERCRLSIIILYLKTP